MTMSFIPRRWSATFTISLPPWPPRVPRHFFSRAPDLLASAAIDRTYRLLLYQKARAELNRIDNIEDILASFMAAKRKELIARYGGSEPAARAALAAQGKDLDAEMKFIEREAIISSYREKYFVPSHEITRSSLWHYYKSHPEEFRTEALIQFRLIDVPCSAFSDIDPCAPVEPCTAAESQARAIHDRLTAGEDFAALARQYSRGFRAEAGGLWNPLVPESLKKHYQVILAPLTQLSPGDFTGVIASADGEHFFIAALESWDPGHATSFAHAQSDIADHLRRQLWQQYSSNLSADLRARATVGDMDAFVRQTAQGVWEHFQQAAAVPAIPGVPAVTGGGQ